MIWAERVEGKLRKITSRDAKRWPDSFSRLYNLKENKELAYASVALR